MYSPEEQSQNIPDGPAPDIAGAWMTEVIDPMIASLEVERKFLGMEFPTWRFEYRDLEIIKPLHGSIPGRNWGSYEGFIRVRNHAELLTGHDEAVEGLRGACEKLQNALEESPEMEALYDRSTSDESLKDLGTDRAALFGARPATAHKAWLAQLVVNTTPELKPIYTIRPLWNTYREEFLALLDDPAIRPLYEEMVAAARRLLDVIDKTSSALSAERRELTDAGIS